MTPTKLLAGQISLVMLIVILGVWFATQWTAYHLGYQAELGAPLMVLFGFWVYRPWQIFLWWFDYNPYAPDLFMTAGMIAASGAFLGLVAAIAGSVLRARYNKAATTFGSARWAEPAEIRRAGLFRPSGVFLGRLGRHYLRHDGPEHVLAFAPTRSGKGVGLVIPTLLTWTGSVIVHDIKGENWELTAGWRSRFSHCVLFNPTDRRAARYNPLLEVRRGANEVRDAQNIADILVDPEGALDSRSHWDKTSHSLLVGVILHILYADPVKTLERVATFLSDPQRQFDDTLDCMMTTNHLGTAETPIVHQVVASAAREILNKSANERSGVLSTAISFLTLYRDPVVSHATSDCDWRISDLIDGDRPLSLYLVIPPSDLSRTKPLVRLILNQIGRRLTERLEGQDDRGGAETEPGQTLSVGKKTRLRDGIKGLTSVAQSLGKRFGKHLTLHLTQHLEALRGQSAPGALQPRRGHQLLMMLDEFPALGRLDFFETSLAFMAGYGIRAYLIAQSLNQVSKAYGETNSILDNCHVRIAFSSNDERTARRISDALGTATEQRLQRNYAGHRMAPWLSHLSVARQETARPLLTPGEVMQLPPSDELVLISGLPPIRARKLRYFEDENFSGRRCDAPRLQDGGFLDCPPARHANPWQGQVRWPDKRLDRLRKAERAANVASEVENGLGPVKSEGPGGKTSRKQKKTKANVAAKAPEQQFPDLFTDPNFAPNPVLTLNRLDRAARGEDLARNEELAKGEDSAKREAVASLLKKDDVDPEIPTIGPGPGPGPGPEPEPEPEPVKGPVTGLGPGPGPDPDPDPVPDPLPVASKNDETIGEGALS